MSFCCKPREAGCQQTPWSSPIMPTRDFSQCTALSCSVLGWHCILVCQLDTGRKLGLGVLKYLWNMKVVHHHLPHLGLFFKSQVEQPVCVSERDRKEKGNAHWLHFNTNHRFNFRRQKETRFCSHMYYYSYDSNKYYSLDFFWNFGGLFLMPTLTLKKCMTSIHLWHQHVDLFKQQNIIPGNPNE